MGPKTPRSTVLTTEEEAIIVAFRRYTLLPLDDCLYALQATIPHLTHSSLHRCLQRHGISRLPESLFEDLHRPSPSVSCSNTNSAWRGGVESRCGRTGIGRAMKRV